MWFFLEARSRSQAAMIGQPLFRDLAEAERLARIGEEAAEVRFRKDEEEAKRAPSGRGAHGREGAPQAARRGAPSS